MAEQRDPVREDRLPRTDAGRSLADRASALWWQPNPLAGANAMQSATRDVRAAVLAIESEAAIRVSSSPTDAALPFVEVRTTACHAGSDGECQWAECPQTRDAEPMATGRHCPLDAIPTEAWTPVSAASGSPEPAPRPEPLDVERLYRAMVYLDTDDPGVFNIVAISEPDTRPVADALAREYAALAPSEPTDG